MKRKRAYFIIILLMLTFQSFMSQAEEEYDTAPVEAGTFQGKILEIEEHDLVVQKSDGEVVRIPMPGETGKRVTDFDVEEVVELTLTSKGITTSVIPIPGEIVP